MKCIKIQENLDALLDGEVEKAKKREIENHLETCASCQTEFENLQAVGKLLKQNAAVSAPPFLDAKVFKEFDDFHKAKPNKEKFGWFAVPRFAFAAALLLLTLGMFSAFQIGKLSASGIVVAMPEVQENKTLKQDENISASKGEKTEVVKIVEVPVIKEKIVEVPVIREKIVTRIVYKEKDEAARKETNIKNGIPNKQNVAQANIDKFQIVSELKPHIIKTGENNEK